MGLRWSYAWSLLSFYNLLKYWVIWNKAMLNDSATDIVPLKVDLWTTQKLVMSNWSPPTLPNTKIFYGKRILIKIPHSQISGAALIRIWSGKVLRAVFFLRILMLPYQNCWLSLLSMNLCILISFYPQCTLLQLVFKGWW